MRSLSATDSDLPLLDGTAKPHEVPGRNCALFLSYRPSYGTPTSSTPKGAFLSQPTTLRLYLVECKGAHSICGQLHCVQQGHLNEAVGLGATGWPVLITLHLCRDGQSKAKNPVDDTGRCPKAQAGGSGEASDFSYKAPYP